MTATNLETAIADARTKIAATGIHTDDIAYASPDISHFGHIVIGVSVHGHALTLRGVALEADDHDTYEADDIVEYAVHTSRVMLYRDHNKATYAAVDIGPHQLITPIANTMYARLHDAHITA